MLPRFWPAPICGSRPAALSLFFRHDRVAVIHQVLQQLVLLAAQLDDVAFDADLMRFRIWLQIFKAHDLFSKVPECTPNESFQMQQQFLPDETA